MIVVKPTAVALKRKGRKPALTKSVAQAVVIGGEQVPGNGQFSFGWRAPSGVQLLGTNGQTVALSDVESVLFVGGMPVDKAQYDQLKAIATAIDAAPSATEIADDRQTHIVDNGATLEMADEVPRGDFRDDFWDHVRRMDRAAIGPQGQPLDEFDQRWQMQQSDHAELVATAPFTRNNPVSVLKGLLGGQATVVVGDPMQTVAYWVGDDAETLPITVTLAPITNDSQAAAGLRLFARIKFGTRAFAQEADIDIGRGCQFTVSGSQMTVLVGVEADGGVTGSAVIAGMISFHTVVRTTQLVRTQHTSVGNNGSTTVTIPLFAKNLVVWRQDAQAALTLAFEDPAGAPIFSLTKAANAGSPETAVTEPIALPNSVSQLLVTNTNNHGSVVSLIWGLSL